MTLDGWYEYYFAPKSLSQVKRNDEHVEILKKGREVWSKWRKENPEVIPALDKVDFSYSDLSHVNLSGAILSNANLIGADLTKSNLAIADLRRANLTEANLSMAYLRDTFFLGANLFNASFRRASARGTDFSGANLRRADFTETKLNSAIFSGSNLNGADFSKSEFAYTKFNDVDLSETICLEAVLHKAPSTIGIDTLYKSKGNIPEAFLRGCGVPDQMIEYAKSLTGSPIEYYSCFISYSHEDEEFARRVHNDMQAAGVRCWFAPHDMKIGDKIRPTIDESIRVHDKLLLILSEHSVQSDWVEHEIEHALDIEKEKKKNVLFPVRVDEAVMESKTGWAGNVRHQRHIGDFTLWKDHDAYRKAFSSLLLDLKVGVSTESGGRL